MADLGREDDAHARAAERAKTARYGIGAAVVESLSPEDDGWRGSVAVTDASGERHLMLVAVGADVPLGRGSARPELIAALVEEMAGDYPEDGRLHAMRDDTSQGPGLRLDKRFPDLWRGAFNGA